MLAADKTPGNFQTTIIDAQHVCPVLYKYIKEIGSTNVEKRIENSPLVYCDVVMIQFYLNCLLACFPVQHSNYIRWLTCHPEIILRTDHVY